MSASGGYIRIYRKIRDNPIWRAPADAFAFIDLLLAAAWKDHTTWDGRLVRRGEVHTSQVALGRQWSRSARSVARLLRKLVAENMITIRTDRNRETGGTVITILNFERYQGAEDPAEEAGTSVAENRRSKRRSNFIGETDSERRSNRRARADDAPTTEEVKEVQEEQITTGARPPVAQKSEKQPGATATDPDHDTWTDAGNAVRELHYWTESQARRYIGAAREAAKQLQSGPGSNFFDRMVAYAFEAWSKGHTLEYSIRCVQNLKTFPPAEYMKKARTAINTQIDKRDREAKSRDKVIPLQPAQARSAAAEIIGSIGRAAGE